MLKISILSSTILTLIFSFSIGFWTIMKNPRSKINVLWFLTMMAVAVWTFGYTVTVLSSNNEEAFFNFHIVYLGATVIPILFFHFVAAFLFKDKKYLFFIVFGYLLSIVFLYLNIATRLVVSGAIYVPAFQKFEEVTGPLFNMFLLYFGFYTLLSLFTLTLGYSQSDGIRKKQLFFILLASVVGFGGGMTNFLSDLLGIYPYGQFIVWIFPTLITYGIFLEEIKLRIR